MMAAVWRDPNDEYLENEYELDYPRISPEEIVPQESPEGPVVQEPDELAELVRQAEPPVQAPVQAAPPMPASAMPATLDEPGARDYWGSRGIGYALPGESPDVAQQFVRDFDPQLPRLRAHDPVAASSSPWLQHAGQEPPQKKPDARQQAMSFWQTIQEALPEIEASQQSLPRRAVYNMRNAFTSEFYSRMRKRQFNSMGEYVRFLTGLPSFRPEILDHVLTVAGPKTGMPKELRDDYKKWQTFERNEQVVARMNEMYEREDIPVRAMLHPMTGEVVEKRLPPPPKEAPTAEDKFREEQMRARAQHDAIEARFLEHPEAAEGWEWKAVGSKGVPEWRPREQKETAAEKRKTVKAEKDQAEQEERIAMLDRAEAALRANPKLGLISVYDANKGLLVRQATDKDPPEQELPRLSAADLQRLKASLTSEAQPAEIQRVQAFIARNPDSPAAQAALARLKAMGYL